MQVNIKYNEKELAIFQSIIQLLRDGAEWNSIKVADIAAGANIGKGTVYAYFSSKEEILDRAIAFGADIWLRDIVSRVKLKTGFANKVREAATCIEEGALDKQLLSKMHYAVPQEGEDTAISPIISTLMQDAFTDMLRAGIEEGVIPKQPEEYAVMSLFYLFGGFAVHQFTSYSVESDAKEKLLRMITGALKG